MEERGQVLLLTPQLPYPPHQGGAIRNYHLLRNLSQGYAVSLLSFADGDPAPEHLAELRSFCRCVQVVPMPHRTRADRLRTLLTTRDPDMADRLASERYEQALRQLLETARYPIVQAEGMEMARYALQSAAWSGPGAPAVVFDDLNAEYLLQRRACVTDLKSPRRWPQAAYSAVQWLRLRRYERMICQRADATIAVSQLDAEAIARLAPGVEPLVVPNGVDTRGYRTDLPDTMPLQHPNLVFTGKMDFRPNVDAMRWFCAQVWPAVRAQLPGVHLYIVGQQPDPEILRLGAEPDITVTGYVPEILPYFGGADVYAVPMRVGGGTRLKVLEAMATGRAIVSTRLGAEGIDLEHNVHALLADDARSFAEATVRLLQDPALRAGLGKQARKLAEARYDWQQIVPALFPLYECLVSSRRAA